MPIKLINFIIGGSNICGTSYSAVKRHARSSKIEKEDRPIKNALLNDKKEISFDENDRDNFLDLHYYGLVITLYVLK